MNVYGTINGQPLDVGWDPTTFMVNGCTYTEKEFFITNYLREHASWTSLFDEKTLTSMFGEHYTVIRQSNPLRYQHYGQASSLLGMAVIDTMVMECTTIPYTLPIEVRLFVTPLNIHDYIYSLEYYSGNSVITIDGQPVRLGMHHSTMQSDDVAFCAFLWERHEDIKRILSYYEKDHTRTTPVYTLQTFVNHLLTLGRTLDEWYTVTSRVYGLLDDASRLGYVLDPDVALRCLIEPPLQEIVLLP